MTIPRVKVANPSEGTIGTECYIGENKISGVQSVSFCVRVDEIPHFTFETLGFPDVDMSGDIQFSFAPETVQQAAIVLQKEFKSNLKFRRALIETIASALKEFPDEAEVYDAAEKVTDRIIGIKGNDDMGEALCRTCRQTTGYAIHSRIVECHDINGISVQFNEKYATCNECGNEVMIPGLDGENVCELERVYNGLKGVGIV